MKYIVEMITVIRQVYVVEAENEESAMGIASLSDSNWQEHLGDLKVDISEYSEERIKLFKEKEHYWAGFSFIQNDVIKYKHDDGRVT